MKKVLLILLVLMFVFGLAGCATVTQERQQYRTEFLGTFDTVVTLIAYAESEQEFTKIADLVYGTFFELHQLFDIYNDHDGVVGTKAINDNAGIVPVKVDGRVIDLILTAKEWHQKTDGAVNIALGPVLAVWHEYRDAGIEDPGAATLPSMAALQDANGHTDIDKIVIDEEASTVYIEAGMRLDVGALAKGYATQAAAELLKQNGFDSVLISAGGNVKAVGKPEDGERDKWGVGIKDPASDLKYSTSEQNLIDAAYVADLSVVSSGSYERFFTVDGSDYHHLIDPSTLMPANYYTGVSVITQNATDADVLSTAIFILPPDAAMALVEGMDGVEALWVMADGQVSRSSGMAQYLRDMGGATNGKQG